MDDSADEFSINYTILSSHGCGIGNSDDDSRYVTKNSTRYMQQQQQQNRNSELTSSPASRPEDLGIRPAWYSNDRLDSSTIGDRPYLHSQILNERPNLSVFSASRERESSIESADLTSSARRGCATLTSRKAYMDLSDAMALLDETCPNQEASPSLTPKTPRTPLTPFPIRGGRRPRSKSSDNSSIYSNQELQNSERALGSSKQSRDKKPEQIKQSRPLLRKIGISKTEDRPFLAKITPRIIGKPYLEKIGPSRAVEKPFLDKIGSSRTLDRFTFEALRELPRTMVRRCQPIEPSPLTIERAVEDDELGDDEDEEEDDDDDDDDEDDVVICIVKDIQDNDEEKDNYNESAKKTMIEDPNVSGNRLRSNGKAYLLKMYSFETEDLNEILTDETITSKTPVEPPREISLDNALDSAPSSFPPSEDSQERASSSRSDVRLNMSVAELVKCRITTSDEIFKTSGPLPSSRETTSWENSPRWPKRRSRRAKNRVERDEIKMAYPSDVSTAGSPTKRRQQEEEGKNNFKVFGSQKYFSLPVDDVVTCTATETRRQDAEERLLNFDEEKSGNCEIMEKVADSDGVNFARCKSRRQNLKDNVEKLGGTDYSGTKTRRQVSEEILDRKGENGFDDPKCRFDRRGISSDNLKLSRETVVGSVPSTSSLGYQSGDSSLVSQRSSHHSQDIVRGAVRLFHDKYELDDVPSESYAAFKRRTRANHYFNINVRNNVQAIDDKVPETSDGNGNSTNRERNEHEARDSSTRSASDELLDMRSLTKTKSVLRKQEGVDQQSDNENDNGESSVKRRKPRIYNEPSQETMDLLTELRRVKSLLKTPSNEAKQEIIDDDQNNEPSSLARFPKKILLTDREFCLSVERENSVRGRASSLLAAAEDESLRNKESDERWRRIKDGSNDDCASRMEERKCRDEDEKINTGSFRRCAAAGPALFEKRCLSLDYADDVKPQKPEARAISLVASRNPRSEDETMDSSDPAGLDYDARSYCSDVFTSPSADENEDIRASNHPNNLEAPSSSEEFNHLTVTSTACKINNNCPEVDIAIPVDHAHHLNHGTTSSKRRIHVQGRTSDFYEIISPRSTPFRVKKRLGRISVEDTVKQSSFTLEKVDCRTVATQKRTKCFPL